MKIKKDLSHMNIKEIEENMIKVKVKNENYAVIILNSKENCISNDKALEY